MGAYAQGQTGDAETGHVGHAGVDTGVEAEGAWKRVEEVAEWKGEIDGLAFRRLVVGLLR